MTDAMTANPFAALLNGVPRYVNHYGDMEIPDARYAPGTVGDWFKADEVLAALAAAVPDDLAEAAGDLLPDLQRAADDGDIDCKEAVRLITALLARIAAQEVQIKKAQEEWDAAIIAARGLKDDAEAAETALADERAKVAKLVEALTLIESMTVHSGGEIHGVTLEHYRTAVEVMRQEASIALDEIGYGVSRAAITEAGQ